MTLESYLLFIGATILLIIAPGPDMMYLLGRSIAQGRRAGLLAALGINLGGYVHLGAAILGLSAILATSSLAFTLVKWAGAIYLLYLGIQALRSRTAFVAADPAGLPRLNGRAIFWQGFVSDVLNPKVALFFLALLPQFVDPHGNTVAQLLLLGVTVNVIAIMINALIVCGCSLITEKLRQDNRISAWLHRGMGTIFVVLGLKLATEKS